MLSYLIIILLIFILVLLLKLVFRGQDRQETIDPLTEERRIQENQMRIMQEIRELKKSLEDFQTAFEQESERWRTVNKPNVEGQSRQEASQNKQNLLLYERYKDVFDLQTQGLSAEEIAKKLNKGYGEVAFIIELASQNRT